MTNQVVKFCLILFITLTFILKDDKPSFAVMSHYQEVKFNSGMVKCDVLNVRSGPGLNFPVVCKIYRGEFIRIFAKINRWYVVQTENDYIGMVREDYIKVFTENSKPKTAQKSILTSDEQKLLNLVNQARVKKGIRTLKVDLNLLKVARAKAEDMVKRSYFSHNSPTYGSPFEMIKRFGVNYKTAGENIAGSAAVEDGFNAWLKSEGHRKNLLNSNFNYTGIAVINSKIYGKIIVQEFIGK